MWGLAVEVMAVIVMADAENNFACCDFLTLVSQRLEMGEGFSRAGAPAPHRLAGGVFRFS
jgi:hypothetical protein